MMMQIGAMLDAEPAITGAEMARKLTAQGFKARNGAELRGTNVLREYRRWQEKQI
jgi:hypothetical protein